TASAGCGAGQPLGRTAAAASAEGLSRGHARKSSLPPKRRAPASPHPAAPAPPDGLAPPTRPARVRLPVAGAVRIGVGPFEARRDTSPRIPCPRVTPRARVPAPEISALCEG